MLYTSLRLLGTVALATAAPSVIKKDVVIVGGGASGAYAAVRLREDYGKSIALIEKQDIIGGMVDSFTDASTGQSFDYGVVSFIDSGNATGFFERLGIELGTTTSATVTTQYYDFTTGRAVNYTPPAFADQLAGLASFLPAAEKYEPLIQGPGYFDFPTDAADIPEDLLLPFVDFVTKYGAEEALPFIYQTTGLGMGNVSAAQTIWALQAFGASMARSVLGIQGSLAPASGRNQDIYDAVADLLADDVYTSTTVTSTRHLTGDAGAGVELTVRNAETGETSTIQAGKLLLAIEPTAENIEPFAVDPASAAVLAKFTYAREYTGIIDNADLVANKSYFNMPASAAPANHADFPQGSYTARVDYIGSGTDRNYFRVTIIGDDDLDSADDAKAMFQAEYSNLVAAGAIDGAADEQVSWVDFSVHGPMHAHVSEADLKAGFLADLYALQGKNDTWWTGGAWAVNFQTHLWEFDDIILPKLVASL
ncbi:hypothetical protein GMORB2_7769 [Geosmithia morbida]|uniref:Uncharacterized protein n=1 Tax=Geosmithia morbida TaxID=1094350 RepID=A0A9P5D350_9HYPO|nr:uncharacterized protein GMORB2_7769 [Geosmithia morbida]KAF4122176.1 hypothetical protein GMORB2_7769 [Geosmithia morbida]